MLAKALASASASAAKVYVEEVFSTYLYTGNNSTQTITNGIDLSGKGGLVWIKGRQTAFSHVFVDTTRGATKFLSSNNTTSEQTAPNTVPSFSSTGFTAGTDNQVNLTGDNFASWTFRKAAKFFDVVTYTGNGTNRTIAHNLGSVPGCIIVKCTSISGNDWQVYHRSLTNAQYLSLNLTSATATSNALWNNTAPTSTVFSLGTDLGVNSNGRTYVAYLFAHDAGGFGNSGNDSVVKCGTFTPNGSYQATVDLGWEPQWVLIKSSTTASGWYIIDNMRGWANGSNDAQLQANSSSAESSAQYGHPLATGFYADGFDTSIYIAIRRGPMKTPTDATKVFSATAGTDTAPYSVGFPTDLAIIGYRNGNANYTQSVGTRLTGNSANLFTSKTNAEDTSQGQTWSFDLQNSFDQNWVSPAARWNFRRAPGFFDVVAYTGTGVARTVNHNLGVVPELMIVKSRSSGPAAPNWWVYCSAMPTPETSYLNLEGTGSRVSGVTVLWNSTNPTSSGFSLGTYSGVNGSTYTYIAYLFATLAGISKVGSYTGTGTTLSVDCGFTNGSRLVLIKRTDSTGSWYIWDSARGIVSGNDPYLLLNSTAAEVTNTDYIDPLSSGFQISSTAPAEINANGGSYIFLAVA